MDNNKQTILVFGATGGIGKALCQRLTQQEDHVIAIGRDKAKLSQLQTDLGCEVATVDPLNAEAVNALIKNLLDNGHEIQGIANCVGSIVLKPAHRITQDEFSSCLQINLGSCFAITHAAGQNLKHASIVFCSSVAANIGLSNHEAIAAAKAGIQGLAISAAASYAKRGLRFNTVAPALTRTPMTASITSNDNMLQASAKMHPLGRIGEPEEVAAAIQFLLDPTNSWITGQNIGVDGGMSMVK